MKKTEAYSTLHEIRLRKETILSEIRNDNQQISILWKDLFRKPEPRKKGFTLANVMNREAANFYHSQGAERIEPAFEQREPAGAALMFCRHCLRYSMGWCPVHQKGRSPYREPYYLLGNDGRRFRLEFDCKNCQMKVYGNES